MNNMGIDSLIGEFILLIFLIVIIVILMFAFWIWMLIDCLKRKFGNDTEKIVWVLVIIFLGAIGAAVYYFVVKTDDKKIEKAKSRKK